MNKNLAILTFHYASNRNFGASLQSYAVGEMIKKIKKNVSLINYSKDKLGIKAKIRLFFDGRGFIDYNKKFLKTTKKVNSFEELKELNKEFDTFVVGSDQVWRSKWLQDKLPHYYFDFVDDDKTKIAYAASFGVDHWEGDKELTEKIRPL
ncbi:MAG: polysaccharide pyruvyl transferase family protein, partial [Fusobacteriaceae bacterium]